MNIKIWRRTSATKEKKTMLSLPNSPFLNLSLPQKSPKSSASPFLHGSFSISLATPKAPSSLSLSSLSTTLPTIQAVKRLQGKVICSINDKTVNVEVTRIVAHPKYLRRIKKKKKYQAHDPDNQFNVGDFVTLLKCRPISKTKTFVAVPYVTKKQAKAAATVPQELGLPLQSQQEQAW